MLRGFTKEELLKHLRDQREGQGAAVPPREDPAMTTETGITGGEVAVEVMTSMNVTGTVVGETETIVAEAGAVVPVLITRVAEGAAMMMNVVVEAGAYLWTVAPLQNAVLVLKGVLLLKRVFPLKGVLPPEKVHEAKVLKNVAEMEGLQRHGVSHHVVALMLREAHLLVIQMAMNSCFL